MTDCRDLMNYIGTEAIGGMIGYYVGAQELLRTQSDDDETVSNTQEPTKIAARPNCRENFLLHRGVYPPWLRLLRAQRRLNLSLIILASRLSCGYRRRIQLVCFSMTDRTVLVSGQ